MRNETRLTDKMRVFLRGIRERLVVLPALVARENIDPRRLARWLRIVAFRESLGEVLAEVRMRVRLELDLLASAAAREMSEMLRLKRPDPQMVALCAAILEAQRKSRLDEQAARERRRRLRRRASGGTGKPPASGRRELGHRASRGEEDELLTILAAPDGPAEPRSADGGDAATSVTA
jgi:hypothetical protein